MISKIYILKLSLIISQSSQEVKIEHVLETFIQIKTENNLDNIIQTKIENDLDNIIQVPIEDDLNYIIQILIKPEIDNIDQDKINKEIRNQQDYQNKKKQGWYANYYTKFKQKSKEYSLHRYKHDPEYVKNKKAYVKDYYKQNPKLIKNKVNECQQNRNIYNTIKYNNYDLSSLTPQQKQICYDKPKYFIKKYTKENDPLMQKLFEENIINNLNV